MRRHDRSLWRDTKSLSNRYGESSDTPLSNALISTVHIPSPILKSHNIEILISSLNISPNASSPLSIQELYELALAPTAETPKSFQGAVQYVLYPVHKAIIVADGLADSLSLGRYLPGRDGKSPNDFGAVQIALDLRGSVQSNPTEGVENVAVLNMEKAAEALALFRESTDNGTAYEQGWFSSGMPAVTNWLAQGVEAKAAGISPAVSSLTRAVLDQATANIMLEKSSKLQELSAQFVPHHVRQPLDDATKAWALRGHTELRNQLDIAFASENWAKLRWWKLLWRVDDVSMFTSEVLERNWLVQAEKGLIWLAGRGTEAGVFNAPRPSLNQTSTLGAPGIGTGFESLRTEGSMPARPSDLGAAAAAAAASPWPTELSTARATLQATTVPVLQSTAQSLVMQSVTITTVTAALSGLLFTSGYATSLYECGAVAAFGLVWSLRRLQKRWEQSKDEWEGEIREAGRVVLKDTEEQIQTAIRTGGQAPVDTEGDEERRVAQQALDEAKSALEEVSPLRKK